MSEELQGAIAQVLIANAMRTAEALDRVLAAHKLARMDEDQISRRMDAVAVEYAHSLALELECVLMDYDGKYYNKALDTLSKYREAMNEIHEEVSPTFLGEPLIVGKAVQQEPFKLTEITSWDLDEDVVSILSNYFDPNSENLPKVTFAVGYIRCADGSVLHGLFMYDTEYPEEGATMLVQMPAPQVVQPEVDYRQIICSMLDVDGQQKYLNGDMLLLHPANLRHMIDAALGRIAPAEKQCEHHFVRDQEAPTYHCCQKCGAIKRDGIVEEKK